MNTFRLIPFTGTLLLLLSVSWSVPAQEVSLQNIAGNVYCISDIEGNSVVLVTPDGILMADARSVQSAKRVRQKLDTLFRNRPVKYIINTHYHSDQTGGNEVFGPGATIVMHPNCKASLAKEMASTGGSTESLKNIVTWKEGMKFQVGGETVRLFYYGSAHTSGDLVVVFDKAKVVYMSDLLYNGIAPFLDVADNSSSDNWVKILNNLFTQYVDYIYIPCQGRIANVMGIKKFSYFLTSLREQVSVAVSAGKTKEETLASIDLQRYSSLKDPRPEDGLTIEHTIGELYDEMTRGRIK